jgi:hypothetical protein
MDALVDALQGIVIAEPDNEIQPVPTQPDDATIETQLTRQISTLWIEHTRLSADRRTTAMELRQIRAILAERLFAMKSVLSRPGRGGQWRSWLKERGIPRSSADRLCDRHAETLGSDYKENVLIGAISDSPDDSAEKLAKSVWQRFGKLLATEESVIQFIGRIAELAGLGHEQRAEGLMIFHAVPKAAEGLPATAIASESAGPAPQPPDGGDANSADAPAEVAAGTPATEQVAGVGGDHAEAVA